MLLRWLHVRKAISRDFKWLFIIILTHSTELQILRTPHATSGIPGALFLISLNPTSFTNWKILIFLNQVQESQAVIL